MIDEIDLDFVDIVIPPKDHLKFIKIAAKKNINIICQKPFTNSYSEAIEAINFLNTNNVLLIVHENFRFQPWYIKIKKILEKNSLGELFQVNFRMRPGDGQGKNAYLDRQPYFQKMERFLIRETAIHFIDVFRFLFGEIDSVFANLSKGKSSFKVLITQSRYFQIILSPSPSYPLESAELLLAGLQFLTDHGIYPWSPEDLQRRHRAIPGLIEAQLKAKPGTIKI